jgi:GTP-binding protein HflX
LDEVADADLIIHVVDGSDPNPEWQVEAVREVFGELEDRRNTPMPRELLVVNKTDVANDVSLARLRHLLPGAVFVSAHSGAGISALRERIAELLPRPEREIDVLVPYARGELVARVHREGEVLTERHTEEGTALRARVKPDLAGVLAGYSVNGTPA